MIFKTLLQVLIILITLCCCLGWHDLAHTDGCNNCTKKDYPLCHPGLCPSEKLHIGCDPQSGGFQPACGHVDNVLLKVDGGLRETILQHINVMRNMVASGLFKLDPAARMPTMAWDHDLAHLAVQLARQCDREGKFCSNTPKYNYVATVEITGTKKTKNGISKYVVNEFIPIWLNDVMGCKMDETGQIVPKEEGLCVGHYIPLIQDNGDRMGCAIRMSSVPKNSNMMALALICNFSRARVNDMPPYKVGIVPGEDCTAGKHSIYSNLCHPDEEVDYNYMPRVETVTENCDELREQVSNGMYGTLNPNA